MNHRSRVKPVMSYRPRRKDGAKARCGTSERKECDKYPSLEFDVIPDATGSLFAQYDNEDTKLLTSIYGPRQSRDLSSGDNDHRGQFTCSFEFASYIMDKMNENENKRSKKLKEKIENNMNCVFNFNILLSKYPKCNIDCFIYCMDYSDYNNIGNDNLLLCHCINSLSIALMDARIEMKDTVSSVYCQCFKNNISDYSFQIEPNLTKENKENKVNKNNKDKKKNNSNQVSTKMSDSLLSDMTICYSNSTCKLSLISMNGSLPPQTCKKAIKQSIEKCQVIKLFMKQTMINRFEKKIVQ